MPVHPFSQPSSAVGPCLDTAQALRYAVIVTPPFATKSPKLFADEQSLYNYAVGALGRRMRTVVQLRRLIRKRVEAGAAGEALVEAVLRRLQAQNYLSDARFSAAYSSLRKENQRWGQRRIEQDLLQKGVHPDVVSREVGEAFAGTDEETQARAFLLRKRVAKPTDQKSSARIFRMLARAGYGGRVAVRILKQWDVPAEALTELEDADS